MKIRYSLITIILLNIIFLFIDNSFAEISFHESHLNVTQISRYMTIKNGSTKSEVNPLLAESTFYFPPSVYTVGQAINQVFGNRLNNKVNLFDYLVKESHNTFSNLYLRNEGNKNAIGLL